MKGNSVKGIVDLRAYAAAAKSTTEWLTGRAAPAFADAGTVVAALAPVGTGRVAALATDEFVVVLVGEIAIRAGGRETNIGAGRSAVLPAGTSFEWQAAAGTLAIVMACPLGGAAGTAAGAAATTTGAAAVPIDLAAPLSPSNPPLASLLVGPTPACRNHSDFRSTSGEFVCGTWDSTPYHRLPMLYRHVELMHLLEGTVTFEDAGGSTTFSAGDTVLCCRGAECAWISRVHVRKIYATHRPV